MAKSRGSKRTTRKGPKAGRIKQAVTSFRRTGNLPNRGLESQVKAALRKLLD